MGTIRICQNCQQPVAPGTPMGLCPRCLMKAGALSGLGTGSASQRRPAFVPPAVEALAQVFPQLELLGLLGQGGMGAVYKARQKQLQRVVALKILPPGIGANPAFAERFTREAQALAQLNHPGIVTLYEFGQTAAASAAALAPQPSTLDPQAPLYFFLMEFVDGVNLGQTLAHGRLAPPEALSLVAQICDALQFAHDQGIVHRDIKPENILLDRRGRVKVADFGLAMLTHGDLEPAAGESAPLTPSLSPSDGERVPGGRVRGSRGSMREPSIGETFSLTEPGKILGTPRYMAPEQLERPGRVDHRADIYALGVVFYQMLTGELPGQCLAPPSQKVALDVRLDEVVLRALEREPERRFQHASELKTSVELIAGTHTTTTETSPSAPPMNRPRRGARGLLLATALVLLVLLAAVAGVILTMPARAPRQQPTPPEPARVAVQTIRTEVGRQLREAGATYDDLQVSLAGRQDKGQPFQVSYRGLRHFQGSDGTTPGASGTFLMEYIGAGQWQGALAGTQFTVFVGSKDNIDLPFVNDPAVLGDWKSVDFVGEIAAFDPDKPAYRGELTLTGLSFLPKGKTPQPWWTWTKGVLIHQGDRTASRYELRQIKGRPYLFLEWKSGDFTISGRKPQYYVLQRSPQSNAKDNQ